MKEFFTTTIGAWDDGSVRLTAPGIAVVVVIIALLVIVANLIMEHTTASAIATAE